MDLDRLGRSRRTLHGLAEGLLAGPQYLSSGTIRLRVVPGGFATVSEPDVSVVGGNLLVEGRPFAVTGTFGELAVAAGLTWAVPTLYTDHSDVTPDDVADLHLDDASTVAEWFARGFTALTSLWPEVTPVLWPEHFDLAISVDEVNYGVSPGDAAHPEPYAYVGPWSFSTWQAPAPWWNVPFGAARPASDLPDVDSVAAFFREGRALSSAT
ncbi:MAG TPA: hypothetical protein VEV13_03920 [Candidatus Limnocylindria bacterium]|nr:hypothetical protein [Candidatus Limnocylindria bacterium]